MKFELVSWQLAVWFLVVCHAVSGSPVVDTSNKEASLNPETPVELNADNFQENVGTGVWWIKYFSPYCHHCATFAPTWNKVFNDLKDNKDGLRFGSVNCVTQGDLCLKKNIQAYPAVVLYKDSLELDHQRGVKGEAFLKKYIADQLELMRRTQDVAANSAKTSRLFPAFPASSAAVHETYPGSPGVDKIVVEGPNPSGESVELTHKEFNRRVTTTRDSWFVQFYSPKSMYSRDIKPAWDQMALQAKGRLDVGHVNCDVEKQLCKEAGVSQTPTLKYFASTMHSEYKGLRGLGDLLQFLERAIEARKPREITLAEFTELRRPVANGGQDDGDVTFVYLYDRATAKEDFQALEKLAVSVVGTVSIVKSEDKGIAKLLNAKQFPALFAVSKDKTVRYMAKSPHDIRDHSRMVEWAKINRTPMVPQLTPFNYGEVFKQQVVVLAILDPRDERSTSAAITELKATAKELQSIMEKEDDEELKELRKNKQLKIDEAKDKGDKKAEEGANKIKIEISQRQAIGVAWIDAVFWERWVKGRYGTLLDDQGGDNSISRVVINHESQGRYWDRTLGGGILQASRTSILETLEAVLNPSPKIRAVSLNNTFGNILVQGWYMARTHQAFTVVFTLTVVAALYYYYYWKRKVLRRGLGGESGSSGGLLGKFE